MIASGGNPPFLHSTLTEAKEIEMTIKGITFSTHLENECS